MPGSCDLAGRAHVSWDDLNGRPFLVLESIGFWMDIVHEHLSDSDIIVQQDPRVLEQLIRSSSFLSFVTDVSAALRPAQDRIRIPIWGTGASATYFAACLDDAGEQVRRVLDLFEA